MRGSTMKRRWLLLLLVTSALAGLASGCGRGTPPTPTTPSSVSDSPATLTFPGQDWGYPSPAAFYPREPGYIRMSFLFDTLTWKDEAGIIPWLANGWEVSEDGTRWTFTLHPGVRWHDGQPLTAGDVAFTFEYMREHLDAFKWFALVGSLPVKCCRAQARPDVNVRAHKPSPAG